MVKTLRISDEVHKEVMKIQGEIQAESGEFTSMDETISRMVQAYRKNHKR
jgi:predicted transcriptional regulator